MTREGTATELGRRLEEGDGPAPIDVGRVVAGKYELVRLLGRGSMGEVWAAHHRTLGEQLALKLLTQSPAEGELEDAQTAAARFLFEAQVAARLSRKTRHIVRVTDHGEEAGVVYLVMELLEGETLESMLARDGRVPTATVVKIVTQVSRALAQAHGEGVLHRDLKPANVFLTRDEEGKLLVKLLDFGIARVIHAHRAPSAFSTAKGLVFGTPSYMSPEQARASSKLDQRCDLWALATIAYESLTGELPVAGRDTDELLQNLCAGRVIPLRQRDANLPAALDGFFARAFSEAIGARFQSATDLAQAFARAAATENSRDAATDPPPPEPALRSSGLGSGASGASGVDDAAERRRVARRRVVAAAAGASVALLVGAGVLWRAMQPATATRSSAEESHSAASLAQPQPQPQPSTAARPTTPVPPAAPTQTSEPPALPTMAVSSLPRAQARVPGTLSHAAAPSPLTAGAPSPAPVPSPAAQPPEPAVAPAPAPSPAPPPPPKKVDKSEVL